MSSQVEGTCPLCMEEMDLTDQQLKPCKCGYEICVWCWHHIIEIAEKNDTRGQCPACRNPYDKERIMGMVISSERLAELSSKTKQKLQKAKSKTSEVRKDLSNVRVILRNLVYMAGVPVHLADEETLRKKEFLGQYGKMLKLVITRAAGAHQHSYNNSCIVHVTFSKKEEALRCIQTVNGFILDGSPLKACFGTTRYCRSWMWNSPCRNPNCLYMHDAGPQEDICTKDEVVSSCTSKFQQCSETALNNFQRRSGSFLPPPIDNFCSSTERPLVSSITPSPFGCGRNLRSGGDEKSGALPRAASCGLRVASGRASYASIAVPQGLLNSSSMSNSSKLTGAEAPVLVQSRDENQSNKQILTPGSQTQLLNGLRENFGSSKPCCHSGYPVKSIVPNFKASLGNNIVMKDTVSKSSCLSGNDDMVQRIIPAPYCSASNGFNHLLPTAADITRQASSCILCSATDRVNWDPGCLDHTADGFFSVREYPVSSLQDSVISNLQAISLGSASASQKMPLYCNWSTGCSNLDLTKSAARFEAKNTSLYSGGKEFGGISTCDTCAIIGQKVGELSTYSAGGIGISLKGSKYSGCGRQDIEFQDTEHRSEHHIPLVKDMVQHVDAWGETNVDSREDSIMSDKTTVDSREDGVISDILSPDLGLVDHLVDLHGLAELFGDTSRGGDCSKVYNSWSPLSSNESRFSFARFDDFNHTSGQSFPWYTDVLDPNRNYDQRDNVGKKAVHMEESRSGLTVNDWKKSEVHNCNCGYSTTEAVRESQHLSRLLQSASSVLKSAVSPAPRFPPGFHPRYTADQGQSCSRPMSCGAPAQYQYSGNQSLMNSSQKISRSNSYLDLETIDSIKMASSGGKLLQSTTHLISPNNGSNLVGLDESHLRIRFQPSVGNISQNSMISVDPSKAILSQNMALNEAVKNYHGSWEACSLGSPTAMESRVVGRKGHSGLTNITSSASPVLNRGFLRPFCEHYDPNFRTPDSSCFYNSQTLSLSEDVFWT